MKLTEKLALIEDILLRSFFAGLILFMLSFLPYLFLNDLIIDVWKSLYGVNEETISIMIISFYGLAKILLFIVFLFPALGILWARKKLAKAEAAAE